MNIYHITYSPQPKIVYLHFRGCNLSCRACLCHKQIWDCHLAETKDTIFDRQPGAEQYPERFLSLEDVIGFLTGLNISQVIFMGAEPTVDPMLAELAEILHQQFHSYNILLTNGMELPSLANIDEVVFSLKAVTDSLHRHYTGQSNQKARNNFITLYNSGIKLRVESVFIPDYIDYPEIENIARFIAQVDQAIPYRVDAYVPVGDNPWLRPEPNDVEEVAEVARKYLWDVTCIRGNESLQYDVIRIF